MKSVVVLLLFIGASCGCDSARPPSPPAAAAQTAFETSADNSPVFVQLPPGWRSRRPTVATVRQIADYPDLDAHFTLAIQARAEFNDDLKTWAGVTQKATGEQTKLTNRTETVLVETSVGKKPAVEYQITGDAAGVRGKSRVIMLRVGEWFCKVTCWTTPENWDAAQPKFDEIIGQLRTRPALSKE